MTSNAQKSDDFLVRNICYISFEELVQFHNCNWSFFYPYTGFTWNASRMFQESSSRWLCAETVKGKEWCIMPLPTFLLASLLLSSHKPFYTSPRSKVLNFVFLHIWMALVNTVMNLRGSINQDSECELYWTSALADGHNKLNRIILLLCR
jgi:hypothetical protein